MKIETTFGFSSVFFVQGRCDVSKHGRTSLGYEAKPLETTQHSFLPHQRKYISSHSHTIWMASINENPACANISGLPFTLTPPLFQRTLVPLGASVMALYILTFWLIFRKLRHSYPRLEKRNFLMITITAFGGLGAAVIQTVFEVIGRSFQPCILFLLTQYSIPVTQSLTSYVMAMSLIAKLLEQRKFREELVKPSRELSTRLDDDENNAYEFSANENQRDQSVKWFQNLNMRVSGYSLSETVVNSCLRPKNSPASTTVEDIQIYNDSNTKLSPQLRTIQAAQIKKRHLVELGCFLVGSSFFVVAYILRISLDPRYQDHDCTGCLYSCLASVSSIL